MQRLLLMLIAISLLVGDATATYYKKRRSYKHKQHNRLPAIKLDTIHQSTPELLETFFGYYLPAHSFNGVILVCKDDEVIYQRYSGWANKEQGVPITEHTPFHIASVSKTFTSMAILKLVEEGKLHLDDKVVKYLPFFLYEDISIQDLLTHRSGLRTYDHFMRKIVYPQRDTFLNNMQILKALNEHSNQKVALADKRFIYSNSNYALLALVIEAVSNTSYKNFMEQHIFQPLDLNDTYVFSLKDTASYTPSYNENFHRYHYGFLDAVVGDKGIYTSASDLLKWDSALYHSFLNASLLNKAFMAYSDKNRGHKNYGLGWRIDSVVKYDKKVVYHFGWWHGNRSVFLRDIKNKTTIIVLSNKFNRNIYKVRELINNYDIF